MEADMDVDVMTIMLKAVQDYVKDRIRMASQGRRMPTSR
jgi:hypothetical protein